MISPDDHRHGTRTGYFNGCREECCRRAEREGHALYRKQRYLARRPLMTDPTGTFRRIRALARLGWTFSDQSRHLGQTRTYIHAMLRNSDEVSLRTERRVKEMFDDLSMSIPSMTQARTRTRNMAQARGWPPPLAWNEDAIDDPEAVAEGVPDAGDRDRISPNSVDPVIVDRILAGEWRLKCTRAEKEAVCARWTSTGGTLRELGVLTGWRDGRYGKNPEQGSRHAGLRWSA